MLGACRRAAVVTEDGLQAQIMPDLKLVLKKEEIDQAVRAMARRISDDYRDRELVMVGILNGAFIFLADLARYLTIPVKIDFVRLASYGSGTASSGTIRLTKELEIDVQDKDVLIVEDIVDTGGTLAFLLDYIRSFRPASIEICAMINKHERRESHVKVAYVGHTVEKGFLVGYGLDYAGNYRQLPAIYDLQIS